MRKFIFDLQRFVKEYFNASPNKILNGTNGADYFKNTGSIVKIFAKGGNDTVKNSGNTVTISSGAGNDSVNNSGGSNITIAGEAGNDTILSYNYSGGNTESVSISGDAGDDSVYSYHGEKITLQGGDGNDTLESRYADYVKIFGGAGNDYLYSYDGENVTLSGGANDDTIRSGYNENISISAGAGNDSIKVGGKNAIILAGEGDDTIFSESYGAIITGGAGTDLIELHRYKANVINYTYGDGDDTILGFNSDDTLRIITSKKFNTLSSGGDLYITFDKGSIVLKDVDTEVVKKNIVTISGYGISDTLPAGLTLKGTTMTASEIFKGKSIDLTKYSTVKTLNASAVTQALKITGNELANKIFGGEGNDTLTGGKCNDIFIHSKGKDVITDYAKGDKIILQDTAIKRWKFSGKNVIFTTDNGSVTVKNGKGKTITITSTKTYSSSSAKNSSMWFTEENNFVTNDNLSSITKNNLIPSAFEKFSATNFENLAQENNLITFSDK